MCADLTHIEQYIEVFEETNMKAIHFDVMDGCFVPNIALNKDDFNKVKSLTSLPIDVHLMVNDPIKYIDSFNFDQGDYISFHPETVNNVNEVLTLIEQKGCKKGLAISPNTKTDIIKKYINDIDYVLVMAVNPGFSGQKMIPTTIDKIFEISNILKNTNIEIIVDGNTSAQNTINMYNAGAKSFVAGTSSLFKNSVNEFKQDLEMYLKETNLIL